MSRFQVPGKHSQRLKEWRAIGKGRGENFFLEHREAVLESLQSRSPPVEILLSQELYGEDSRFWDQKAVSTPVPWYLLESKELDRLISVPRSSGLCGVYRPVECTWQALLSHCFLLVTWGIQDPGNLGTVIRSCAGLVGGGLLHIGGCRVWSAKVARASAGSLLSTDILSLNEVEGREALSRLTQHGYRLWSMVTNDGQALEQVVWHRKDAVLLGNETLGLPPFVETMTQQIRIPMTDTTESLNVAVAGSIVCYERNRERKRK